MATPPPDQPVESAEHPSTFYLTYYNLKIFSGEMDRYELMPGKTPSNIIKAKPGKTPSNIVKAKIHYKMVN
ncbi:hypothetical protein YC2023_107139 [Brassica napus]